MLGISTTSKSLFVDLFLARFNGVPKGKTFIGEAFDKEYYIVEHNCSYEITANGKTKRFNNTVMMAEFLYEQNLDRDKCDYVPPKAKRRLIAIAATSPKKRATG